MRATIRFTLLLAAGLMLPLNASAIAQRALIVTTQDHSFADADDCESFYTRNVTSLPSEAHSREERRLNLAGVDVLRVRTSNEGGVSVRGWDHSFARLTVCKNAVALTSSAASDTLHDIRVSFGPGEVVAYGPQTDQTRTWWVHMILRVPRKANIDVGADNGGIAIRNMSGSVTARATNGGISLASCTGDNRVTTENGGISIYRAGGHLDAVTENGPISLRLHDIAMPALEARTDPEGEIVCNLRACTDQTADWTNGRKRLRIGGAHPVIRLMTNTAPIMIEQVR